MLQAAMVTGDNPWGMVLAVFMHLAIAAYILAVTVVLAENEEKLDTEELKKKFGNLYPNVKLEGNKIYYYPIFMLKRFLLVFIVALYQSYPAI